VLDFIEVDVAPDRPCSLEAVSFAEGSAPAGKSGWASAKSGKAANIKVRNKMAGLEAVVRNECFICNLHE
jgi:hypothetical protein